MARYPHFFTGERVKVPAGYDPKEPGRTPDPFGDKPLYSITAQNVGQYADRLTPGQKGMFKKYPDYRMDIYPTHRIVLMPSVVIENTIKNATSCKTINNGQRLEGCYGGIPFPIPKTGNEAVWNLQLAYGPRSLTGKMQSPIVDANGKLVMQQVSQVDYDITFWDFEGKLTTGYVWKVALSAMILNYAAEAVAVSNGVWIYYEPQALRIWSGSHPLFWTVLNAGCAILPATIILHLLPRLKGVNQFWGSGHIPHRRVHGAFWMRVSLLCCG